MHDPLLDFDAFFQAPSQRKLLTQHELQAILLHILPGQPIDAIEHLSGGYRNANYLIRYQDHAWVLRVVSDPLVGQREVRLLQKLQAILPVPQVIAYRQTTRHMFILTNYCEGVMPAQLSRQKHESDCLALGRCIGSVLGRVHQVHFEASGFLSPDLSFEDPMENLGEEWLSYMRSVLDSERVKNLLDADLRQKTFKLLDQRESDFLNLQPLNRLVHSDFNLKNMLVKQHQDRWQLTAILDWEFAHAGCPWVDLGNLLRFEKHLPPTLCQGLIQGYKEWAGPLPENWRDLARLLDLASMCNFLETAPDKSKTLQTAQQILAETVQRLSS